MNGFHYAFKFLAYFFWIVVIFYFVQVVTEITIIDYKKVPNFFFSLFSMQKYNYIGVGLFLWIYAMLGALCLDIYDYYEHDNRDHWYVNTIVSMFTKTEDKTDEIETIEENIEAKVNMDSLDALPPSPVKSIDDLDLEPEKKKKVEEATIFVKKDGTFDESRGAGISINKSLQFINAIKGIDIEKVVFNLKTFQTMDETVPPFTDVNGSWHIKGNPDELHIAKCFSEESFEQGLDELLKSNNMSKSVAMVDLDKMFNGEPLTFYVGNGFIIDIPPTSQKLIIIKEIDSETEKIDKIWNS